MVKQIGRINKLKTRRGKRALDDRAPKIIENDKSALVIRGGKTNEVVTNVLRDIYMLKKPLAEQLKRRNPFHPFEDETPFERFSSKLDSSLFLFGSNSKKHPNSLVLGRMYDHHLLDMVELRVTNYKSSTEFKTPNITLGAKPSIVLEGTKWQSDHSMKRIGNLMIDFFKGARVDKIRLQGLEHVISLTCTEENTILLRVYRVQLKKSIGNTPRVELLEMGPSIDFEVKRKKLADESLFKTACKLPKQLLAKPRKNTSEDVFGNKLARIHIGKQNTDDIQTRKVKALKAMPKDWVEPTSDGEDGGSREEMGE